MKLLSLSITCIGQAESAPLMESKSDESESEELTATGVVEVTQIMYTK